MVIRFQILLVGLFILTVVPSCKKENGSDSTGTTVSPEGTGGTPDSGGGTGGTPTSPVGTAETPASPGGTAETPESPGGTTGTPESPGGTTGTPAHVAGRRHETRATGITADANTDPTKMPADPGGPATRATTGPGRGQRQQ